MNSLHGVAVGFFLVFVFMPAMAFTDPSWGQETQWLQLASFCGSILALIAAEVVRLLKGK
jgi:uncharacterized membrane protein YagU involved in acid resistance